MEDKITLRRQLYASKTIEELCSLLETMGKDFRGPKMSRELCDLIYTLKTQRLRHRKDAGSFCRAGGVSSLVRMLPVSEETRDHILLLSTIANVCWLDGNAKTQVMNHGLEEIVKILQNSTSNDVLNSASRCLANLAVDEANTAKLQQHGLLQHFLRLLSQDDSSSASHKCRQSVLRGVRILCSSSKFRDELKSLDGISLIVDCLKRDIEDVSLSALQALEVLILQDADPDILRPLCELQAIQCVVRLCNHQKTSVRKSAFQLLLSCTKISDGRVVLSSAGGVETLVSAMESIPKESSMFGDVVRGACVCCREVNSRQRLRDCGGLHKLIKMLSREEHSDLYHAIMSALVCYYFDENTLKVMVRQMGLLGALKHHLELMTKRCSGKALVEEEKEARIIDQSGDSLADCEEEAELIDSEKMTGDSSEFEVENDSDLTDVRSDVMDIGSTTRSTCSSPASMLSLASSSEPASSQQKLSSLQSSGTSSSGTPMEKAACGRSCLHPQQEVEMIAAAELSCLEDAIGSSSSTPSSKRPKLQLELDLSSPMPANFLDSLLSSPNPYQKESKVSESTFLIERNAPLGSQVILMLSRISHLRDFLTYLSSPEMLPAIFNYFAAVKPPDHHIFKVLTRVFMNPHCFQDCISCLLPSKLYELLRVTDSTEDSAGQIQGESVVSPQLPYLSPPHIFSPECSFHSMCGSLIERLSRVAESPYGQGVLAHSLLRGGDREKHASCLSLPLLCRSVRLCQRMMLGYSGFQLLCGLARASADSDIHEATPLSVDIQSMALDSLLQLAHNMIKPSSRKRRHSYPSTSDDSSPLDSLPPSKTPRLSLSHQESLPVDFLTTPQSYIEYAQSLVQNLLRSGLSRCRYADYDHYPFDMVITVENEGSSPPLSIQVHRSMLIENSDVFAVMLGGQYMESSRSEVVLHKIPPLAFLSVIHHTYGCGWKCDQVMERVLVSESCAHVHIAAGDVETNDESVSQYYAQNLSLTSDLLISQIVNKCVGETEKRLAGHCLQVLSCAGMFLLPELVTLCEHEAVRYLVPDNISAMFRFAELHWCMCLAESCIRSLVNLQHSNQRTKILRDIIVESAQGEMALDIIRVFLEQSGD